MENNLYGYTKEELVKMALSYKFNRLTDEEWEVIRNISDDYKEDILSRIREGHLLSEEDLVRIGFYPVIIPGRLCNMFGPIYTLGRVGIRYLEEGFPDICIDGKHCSEKWFSEFDFLSYEEIESEIIIRLYKMTGLI